MSNAPLALRAYQYYYCKSIYTSLYGIIWMQRTLLNTLILYSNIIWTNCREPIKALDNSKYVNETINEDIRTIYIYNPFSSMNNILLTAWTISLFPPLQELRSVHRITFVKLEFYLPIFRNAKFLSSSGRRFCHSRTSKKPNEIFLYIIGNRHNILCNSFISGV